MPAANNVYDVTVQVADGLGGTDTQTIAVTVTNVNEPPVITSDGGAATASVSVAENQTAVTDVNATDPDAGASLTYSIVGGADHGALLDQRRLRRAQLHRRPRLRGPADAGANNVYDVTVQVADGLGGTDTQAIAVSVTNVNDAPRIDDATTSLPENSANGTNVYNVNDFFSGADTDVDGTALTYSITAGNALGGFAINPGTGQITVLDSSVLDFEVNPSFALTVQASDGALSDSATISINLTNVNEPPVITSNGGAATASVSVAENQTAVTDRQRHRLRTPGRA